MSGKGEGISVKVSAPGKVILHGEHSVVYGKLAIAASLGLRTHVILEETSNGKLEIGLEDLNLKREFDIEQIEHIFRGNEIPRLDDTAKYNWTQPDVIDHDKYVAFLVKSMEFDAENIEKEKKFSLIAFFYLYFGILVANNVSVVPMSVRVKSDLTLGAGTGSSASLMVSLAGTLIRYLTVKKPTNATSKPADNFTKSELDLISNWAYCTEKIIHGTPSGIDNTICTFGAMVSFRKGSPPTTIQSSNDIRGLLVDTKVPKNTGILVKKVADLKNRHPKIIESVLVSMDEVTNEALENLVCLGMLENHGSVADVEDCYKNLNELTDINHNLLRTLGVSHPSLDDVISILRTKGLHGKITGSGGGGYAISLIPPSFEFTDVDYLCSELSSKGYQPLVTKLGGVGVTVDV